jgi:hypothetical protein
MSLPALKQDVALYTPMPVAKGDMVSNLFTICPPKIYLVEKTVTGGLCPRCGDQEHGMFVDPIHL